MSTDAALSPRRATHLFLLRQNKVSQKKATRSLGPCASLRAPCGARFKRGHAQTRCAQTSACPDPLEAPLLSPARTGGDRIRGALSPLCGLNAAMFLVASCERITRANGLEHSKTAVNSGHSFSPNSVQQFNRQTRTEQSTHFQTAPGFAEFLDLYQNAVPSLAVQARCGFQRNFMSKLNCTAQIKPQVLRQTLR